MYACYALALATFLSLRPFGLSAAPTARTSGPERAEALAERRRLARQSERDEIARDRPGEHGPERLRPRDADGVGERVVGRGERIERRAEVAGEDERRARLRALDR